MLKKLVIGWIAIVLISSVLTAYGAIFGSGKFEVFIPAGNYTSHAEQRAFVAGNRRFVAERFRKIEDWLENNDPFAGADPQQKPVLNAQTTIAVPAERVSKIADLMDGKNVFDTEFTKPCYTDGLLRRYRGVVRGQSFTSTSLEDLQEAFDALTGSHVILTRKGFQGKITSDTQQSRFSSGPIKCDLAVLDLEAMEVVYRYSGTAESSEEIKYKSKDVKEIANAGSAVEYDIYNNGNKHLRSVIRGLYSAAAQ
jgi:hypothetical protein